MVIQWLEIHPDKVKVEGSTPSHPTRQSIQTDKGMRLQNVAVRVRVSSLSLKIIKKKG